MSSTFTFSDGCLAVDAGCRWIDIEEDALEKDNKEMIEETIAACINELIKQIAEEEAELEEKITGQRGMGF